jgi:hypothetical protein
MRSRTLDAYLTIPDRLLMVKMRGACTKKENAGEMQGKIMSRTAVGRLHEHML